jgi:hypothetical protein
VLTALRTLVANKTTGTAPTSTTTTSSSRIQVPTYPSDALNGLVQQHFRATQSPTLSLSGRYLPLLYSLIATLIAAPQNKAVVIIDTEGRFDATRLLDCGLLSDSEPGHSSVDTDSEAPGPLHDSIQVLPEPRVKLEDLDHVYIYRVTQDNRPSIPDIIASAEEFMVYGTHASKAREWWGTILIGKSSGASHARSVGHGHLSTAPICVTTGWKGWLRVDRDQVRGFPAGMSIEEALAERERRQEAVDRAGWVASSEWGGFVFGRDAEGRS